MSGAWRSVMDALSKALDGDGIYAQDPAELVWRLRDQRDDAREIALDALDSAIRASCSVCGSEYQQRFFGPEENGFHPRIRETPHSRRIGNKGRLCGAPILLREQRAALAGGGPPHA